MSIAPNNRDPVLVVGNLDGRLTAKAIFTLFGKHGTVLKVDKLTAPDTKLGYRVEYDSPANAQAAKELLDGKMALSMRMSVQYETFARGPSEAERISTQVAEPDTMCVHSAHLPNHKPSADPGKLSAIPRIEAKLEKLEQGIDSADEMGLMATLVRNSPNFSWFGIKYRVSFN